MKVLLDTDIGSDIDDAICLAYLLAKPECDLLGITTVSGEPEKRAMLASAVCKAAGKDMPIFPGAPLPLLIPPHQPLAQQASALEHWPHQKEVSRGACRRLSARDNPEASRRDHAAGDRADDQRSAAVCDGSGDSTFAQRVVHDDRLVHQEIGIKGIVFEGMRYEWNALNDPHATAIVYKALPKIHRSVGLDVTLQVQMEAAEVRRRFQTPLLRPVLDMAEVWFQMRPEVTFHDPLAAVSIFDPQVCTYSRGQVDVELLSARVTGHDLLPQGRGGAA